MKKNIALDLDGVFTNFHYSFSQVANKLFGCPIIEDINEVKAYNWWDWNYPLTKEQHKLVWKEIDKNIEDFWFNLKSLVTDPIFRKMEYMEDKGFNFFFVTSRRKTAGKSVLAQTRGWIKKKTFIEHFSIIPSTKKGKILDGIEANYFIDDFPENLIESCIEAPKCQNFLLVRPYNQYFLQFIAESQKFKKIQPVYSVLEFLNIIENNEKINAEKVSKEIH